MSEPDPQRPRPQFGEYATPEQQRAHIREPVPEPAAAPPHPPVAQTPSASRQPQSQPQPVPGRPPHQVDRLVTLMLLGFGLVNVVLQLPRYLDIASLADQAMQVVGITGSFTMTPAAQTWGIVAAVLYGLGYLATLLLSLRRLRRGKVTWWLPLVGAVVTSVVVGLCVAIPLMSDPAVMGYLQQSAG